VCMRVRVCRHQGLPGQVLLGGMKEEGGCAVISSLVSFFFFIFAIFFLYMGTPAVVSTDTLGRTQRTYLMETCHWFTYLTPCCLLLLPCYIYPLIVFRFS
jgi:hypothetical protein